jgi:hypothetical protein
MRNGGHEGNKRQKRTRRTSKLRFYGDQFVLDTVGGRFYRLTPIATSLLKALIEGQDENQLAEIVERQSGSGRTNAMRDVEFFLSEIRSLELVDNSGQ